MLINVVESTKFAIANVTICQEPGKHYSHGAVCRHVLPCTDPINSELTTGNWIEKLTCDVVKDVCGLLCVYLFSVHLSGQKSDRKLVQDCLRDT